jgi:hypothetical protein
MEKDKDLQLIDENFKALEYKLPKWRKNNRAYRAKHPRKKIEKARALGKSSFFVPVTRDTINILVSIFTTSLLDEFPIEIQFVGDEDKAKANTAVTVAKKFYEKSKPRKHLKKAFLSALTYEMGIVLTTYNKTLEKIETIAINPKDVAFDKDAENIDDILNMSYRYKATPGTIKSRFPNVPKSTYGRMFEGISEFQRVTVKEILKRDGKDWIIKTFCKGELLREDILKNGNPFSYGYAIEQNFTMDDEEDTYWRYDLKMYGQSVPEILSELQKEMNAKRNTKNDIQEEQANPSVYVGAGSGLNPNNLKRGAGAKIPVKNVKQILEKRSPMPQGIDTDISLLKREIEEGTGVTSIMRGDTNPSDRRSMTAMDRVDSVSNLRIEDLIKTIVETLYEPWARTFIRLVLQNATDSYIKRLTGKEENPLGKIGSQERKELLDFDIKINFGNTLNKEATLQKLFTLVQYAGSNERINPEYMNEILKEIVVLIKGENTNTDQLFQAKEETMERPIGTIS